MAKGIGLDLPNIHIGKRTYQIWTFVAKKTLLEKRGMNGKIFKSCKKSPI